MNKYYRIGTTLASIAVIFMLSVAVQGATEMLTGNQFFYLPAVFRESAFGQNLIAFSGQIDYKYEIYSVNEEGGQLRKLSNNPANNANDGWIDWHPDGTKIAYTSNRDGNYDIFVMNYDGSDVMNLTNDSKTTKSPSWSADGNQIAFASSRTGFFELYVMDAEGENVTQITNDLFADSIWVQWSPVGSKIAFNPYWLSLDYSRLYIVDVDGSDLEDISFGISIPIYEWSPDGKAMLFISEEDNGDENLYVMNMDSREVFQLTDTSYIWTATWSPDSSRIVYSSREEESTFIINSDGTNKAELLCDSASIEPYDMAWSPDGKKIAYSEGWGPDLGLHVVNTDGSRCLHVARFWASNAKWKPGN